MIIDGEITLKSDEPYGVWRLYPILNASNDGWYSLSVDLSPMISTWEESHNEVHGNIEQIKLVIGTDEETYFIDVFFDDII